MEVRTENIQLDSNGHTEIDEAMLNMGEFVSQMVDVEGLLYDEESSTSMRLESVDLSIPIQLDLQVRNDGSVNLGGSPPLYYADTSVLPVFHQLTIKIQVDPSRK